MIELVFDSRTRSFRSTPRSSGLDLHHHTGCSFPDLTQTYNCKPHPCRLLVRDEQDELLSFFLLLACDKCNFPLTKVLQRV